MDKILLVDYSTVAGRCWHAMRSKGHIATHNSEAAEFAKGLACAAMIIKERFKDHFIMIIADSHSWRHDAWNTYYRKEALEKSCTIDDSIFAYMDGDYFEITYFPTTTAFGPPIKCTKTRLAEVQGHFLWTPGQIDERFKGEILKLLPGYKGSRKDSRWNFSTPKATYKEWRASSAPRFAGLMGAGYACVQGAEADDVIACAIRTAPEGVAITVMSTDQDIAWSETKGYGQFSDRVWSCSTWDAVLKKPIDSVSVMNNLIHKVLIGDPGDDIGPCISKTGARITPVPAKKLVAKGQDLLNDIQMDTWERNWALINLIEEGPLDEEISKALAKPFDGIKPFNSEWGMRDTEWMVQEGIGRSLYRKDQQPENWE